jgi:hypothetical protein
MITLYKKEEFAMYPDVRRHCDGSSRDAPDDTRRAKVTTFCSFTILAIAILYSSTAALSQSNDKVKDNTASEISKIEQEKATRTPLQEKIDSHLLDALKQQSNVWDDRP